MYDYYHDEFYQEFTDEERELAREEAEREYYAELDNIARAAAFTAEWERTHPEPEMDSETPW